MKLNKDKHIILIQWSGTEATVPFLLEVREAPAALAKFRHIQQ